MNEQEDLFGETHPEEAPAPKAEKEPGELTPAGAGLLRRLARPCSLGCGKSILMAATIRKMRGGAEAPGWMPVDVEEIPRDGGGNIRLTAEGRGVRAYVLNAAQRKGHGHLHKSHMETCPNRNRLPKKGGR